MDSKVESNPVQASKSYDEVVQRRKSSIAVMADTHSAPAHVTWRYKALVYTRFFLLCALLIAIILILLDVIPVMNSMGATFINRVRDSGVGGGFAYAFATAAMICACLPNSLMSLGAGYIYGNIGKGFITAWCGILIGSLSSYLAGHYAFKSYLELEFRHDKRFDALSHATKEHGAKVVFFARISPIPSGLINYAFSISGLTFIQFSIATAIGLVPMTVGYAAMGADFSSAYFTKSLRSSLLQCTKNDALKFCLDAAVNNQKSFKKTYMPYIPSVTNTTPALVTCSLQEMYNLPGETFKSDDVTKVVLNKDLYQYFASCIQKVSKKTTCFADIQQHANWLSCYFYNGQCGSFGNLTVVNQNTCLHDLNTSPLWPKILLPICFVIAVVFVSWFGYRALQRAGLMQVQYNLDRQREFLLVEQTAEASAINQGAV